MKTVDFIFDGHEYSFLADDRDVIRDSAGGEVCGEYYHAAVHEEAGRAGSLT